MGARALRIRKHILYKRRPENIERAEKQRKI